ncbi:MAG: ATP-dependent helicase C-terminal domain-containing protein, partial [Pseudomonadota bacterium]
CVIDSGLARFAEFDRAAGTTRLVTRRASQAAAAQRAGRAARQGPGTAYRLWEEAGHAGRPEFAPPEIETADLSSLILKLACWGAPDPTDLPWLDEPPKPSIEAAQSSLQAIGALDHDMRVTPLGKAIASLPMAPNEAAALLFGAHGGVAAETAQLIMLLQERGLGGRSEDLGQRLSRWRTDTSRRAETARGIARGWADKAGKAKLNTHGSVNGPEEALALSRPAFVARRRDSSGEHWISAGGRGFTLDPASPLARAEWIVIGDAQGAARSARITGGVELEADQVERLFKSELEERSAARWNEDKGRVEARRERRLGAISLSSAPDPNPDPQLVFDTLLEKACENISALFPAGFLERARYAGVEALESKQLDETADLWLAPLLESRRDLNLSPQRVVEAALAPLDWSVRQELDERAPRQFVSPADTKHEIDYTGDDAPSVDVRVQALFGLDQHPMVGHTPLLLKLTSPAGRPIQATRDLPGFWRGSWADVAQDMKGRYPKHRWPDEPWLEKPSLKTKNAFNRQ